MIKIIGSHVRKPNKIYNAKLCFYSLINVIRKVNIICNAYISIIKEHDIILRHNTAQCI